VTGDQAGDDVDENIIPKSTEDFTVSTTISIAMTCCKRWPKM